MYPSYKQIQVQTLPVTHENWLTLLKSKQPDRPGYSINNEAVKFMQVICSFTGIPLDEDEYYNQLFEYVHDDSLKLHLISEESLDKTLDNHRFLAIQKIMNMMNEHKLSINRFVAFLDGEQLLLRHQTPFVHRKIRESFIQTIELFAKKEKDGLFNSEFRRVLVDIIKWAFNHLDKALSESDYVTEMPRFLWYGNFKKSHQYFLILLIKLGCDIVMFQPDGKKPLNGFFEEDYFTYQYGNVGQAEPFPKERRARKATVAYRASREIEAILNQEGSGLYKPWQLRDYTPSALTLKTTYDELFILSREIAMVRPGFEVRDGSVSIPALFSKIQGVSKNRKEYWDRIQSISMLEHSLLIRHFPFTVVTSNDFRFHYRDALGSDGLLDVNKILKANYWKYSHLPIGLQKGIGHAIRTLCEKPILKRVAGESIEELKIFIFSQSIHIPNSIIMLMQKFDYSQDIPKLVLYNNGISGFMTRTDALLIALLNQFGLDIVLYNPAGHNDIENYLDDGCYDTHWLEDIVFEQEFKDSSSKKGWFQGLIKNIRRD